jgi:hypothetical protein
VQAAKLLHKRVVASKRFKTKDEYRRKLSKRNSRGFMRADASTILATLSKSEVRRLLISINHAKSTLNRSDGSWQ